MEKKVIGSFCFKKTINGNLIGEFINNIHQRIFADCSETVTSDYSVDDFEGNYKNIWQEDNHSIILDLNIKNNSNSKFSLIWTNAETNIVIFKGEGFLISDNQMTGYYFSI